jgi:Leucine-rich repeat (LRR) protein
MLRNLEQKKTRSLELNTAFGWADTDVSFIESLTFLQELIIINAKLKSVAAVGRLKQLESLTIWPIPIDLDFSHFDKLRECALTWNSSLADLLECNTLENLFLDRFDQPDFVALYKLTKLEKVGFVNSKTISLHGIEKLQALKKLRLGNMSKLESLDGLRNLSELEDLNLDCCKKITNIDALAGLTNLRRLSIDNCGDIASLSPLRNLKNLERVTFVESTNILDGDLSPLARNAALTIAFKNRKHYSHSREELNPVNHSIRTN